MRVLNSKILAAGIAALLLLEAGLRVAAALDYGRAAESDKILVVGDSHALDLHAVGTFQIVNAAEGGGNTSELLEKLPALLDRVQPRALVVLTGEANLWNRHLVSRFLDRQPIWIRFLARWKVVQLFSRIPRLRSDANLWSHFFPDVRVEEYPTLAMRWVGYLDANPRAHSLSQHDMEEAQSVIRRWLADPRSGAPPSCSRALAQLIELAMPRDYRDPDGPAVYGARAKTLVQAGRAKEARELFLRGLRGNPFYAGGSPPPHEFHRTFSAEEFASLLSHSMPPSASGMGEKPGLVTLRESFLREEQILEWVYEDLVDIVRAARDRHVPALLVTYPPDRFSVKERPVDGVIREVSINLGAPLSDLASELNRRWGMGDRSQFYSGDQLNEAGNRAAAEIIAEELKRVLPHWSN